MSKTAKQALAATFGWSTQELHEYRYQYGRTKVPMYAIGDGYFATSKTKPTASDCDEMEYDWIEYSDQFFARDAGTVIWVANAETSDQYSGKTESSHSLKPTPDAWGNM